MAARRKSRRGARHGTRKWVLQVLGAPEAAAGLLTSRVMQGVARLSGTRIPGYSVYQSLRTLVRQGAVVAQRKGREFSYRLASRARGVRSTPATVPAGATLTPEPRGVGGSRVLHTLAVGEVAIVEIGKAHIETATNVHGRLVIERHRRPK